MAFKHDVLKSVSYINLFLAGIMTIVSCGSENGAENTYEKLVKTAKVEKVSSEIEKQFPAIIEEAEQVNLAFRIAGPIKKIYVKEGEFVKKGQLVAEMDTRDYEVQYNAIEAQVKQLQSEYERVAELNKRGSVSENDFEKMKAGKEMAEAKLKNANDMLKDAKLKAPFSGYITKVMFDEGELVNHGTPLANLVDVSLYKVEINVPASLFIQKNKISKLECTQENIPGKTFPLTLYSNNIKANTNGLYKLYLYHKPETKSKLAPGMNVAVHITCSHPETELHQIPTNALYEKEGLTYVWVVKNSKVVSRKVKTNNLIKNGVIGILDGLSEGEEVVIGGLNLLKEEETVKVVPPASKTNVGNVL